MDCVFRRLTALAFGLVLVLPFCTSFKEHDFKKCKHSSFCERLRGINNGTYAVQPDTVVVSERALSAKVIDLASQALFDVRMSAYDNTLRIHVDESGNPRFQLRDILMPGLEQVPLKLSGTSDKHTSLTLGAHTIKLQYSPFQIDVAGAVIFNSRNMFAIEHRREKSDSDAPGLWKETFKGHEDSKPKGPQALGFDLTFPSSQHVYGLPQHATSLSLKPTAGEGVVSEPYRLYNLDVFEYLTESPFGLYGSIPFLIAHSPSTTIGAFWLNAAEMYVDVERGTSGETIHTQWWAESGVLDLFILLGPTPATVSEQYAALTGTTALPQMFSLGYHQCRWNYKDEDDVAAVNRGFDENTMPADVIWLDIEHTDGKRYMTWDASKFPQPEMMLKNVASTGRKMVTIVDPHVKRDAHYALHNEATQKRMYVRNKDGGDFEGWCWPGSSSYLDVLDPSIRSWWASQFLTSRYHGSTTSLFIWNDMNEPSVFNGPEITMPKDALHLAGSVEHRDVHNVYGLYYHLATAEGLQERGFAESGPAGARPFVLSRAFFAGTQRVGPIWTGDNGATWDHLRVSVPMLLSLNIAGLPNCGADVGGFFGNPDAALLTRWYQAAIFYPFLRGHAHLETKRREPWLFGEPSTTRIRAALRQRYAMLPYLYTLFRAANTTGDPIMRPLWFDFPQQPALFEEQHQFMFGPAMLAAPVLEPSVESIPVNFPQGEIWYDGDTGARVHVAASGATKIPVSEDSIPRYYRGGHIVPRRERPRRSTAAQARDPYTLVVALNDVQAAAGSLYVDDGASFGFLEGAYVDAAISYADGVLSYNPRHVGGPSPLHVERVVVLGFHHIAPSADYRAEVSVPTQGRTAEVEVARGHVAVGAAWERDVLVVRNPQTPVSAAWSLRLLDL